MPTLSLCAVLKATEKLKGIGSPLRTEESGSAVMDVLLGQFQTSKPDFQVPAINEWLTPIGDHVARSN
jgi:hypothetical protein